MKNMAFSESPCICLQVRMADRHLSRLYDTLLRPCGIRITQLGLLFCVQNLDKPSISEIGHTLSMDQTTVTRNIMKLEKMGFVETRQSKNSHRKLVIPTQSGLAAISDGLACWQAAQSYVKQYLGDTDYALLLKLMNKLSTMPAK